MSTPAMTAAPSTPAAPSSAPASSAPVTAPSAPSKPQSGAASTQSGAQSAPATGVSTPSNPTGGAKPDAAKTADSAATPAAADAATKAEAARKLKLKVNGKEMELDEGEVVRRAQLAEAAQQKFQEAAEVRKQAAQLIEMFRKDPIAVMQKLGLNPREFSEKFLAGELQKEMLTPEQRELMELRQFRETQEQATKQAEAQRAEQVRQAEFQKLQQKAAADYDSKMTEALATANMPKNAETVKRVAARMLDALQKGYELDAPTAVDLVRQDIVGEITALAGGLKGESLLKFLGEGVVKELRAFDLARIKAKLNPPAAEGAAPAAPQNSAPTQRPEKTSYMSRDEWIESIRKKAGV